MLRIDNGNIFFCNHLTSKFSSNGILKIQYFNSLASQRDMVFLSVHNSHQFWKSPTPTIQYRFHNTFIRFVTPGIPPGITTTSYFPCNTSEILLSGLIATPRLHVLGLQSGTPAIVTSTYRDWIVSILKMILLL